MLKHHASVSLAELQRGDVGTSRVYMRQAYRHLLPEELYAPRIRMPQPARWHARPDRKSVASGKSVSVRVDLGGRRIIKKKKDTIMNNIRCTSPLLRTKLLTNQPRVKQLS